MGQLDAALKLLPPETRVVMFGRPGVFAGRQGVKHLGLLRDDISLRLAYSAADVFVAPQVQEAFGLVMAEAMACGTPVVAFDATGPRDIVEHKVNGYAARPFDPEDLAAGIRFVLEDKERRSQLSQAARQKAMRCFSPEPVAQRYLEVYRKAKKRIG